MRYYFLILLLLIPYLLQAQLKFSTQYGNKELTFKQNTANEVQNKFRKELQGVHPRLFYNQRTIDRIKQLYAQNDPFVVMYAENAHKEADQILKEPLLDYYLDDAGLRIPSIHKFATQAPHLIFMYQMTGETKYADRCYQQLAIFCKYPDWGADRHFLDTGIGAFNFAFVYDGLYNYMTPDQRKILEEGVLKHALNIGKYQIDGGKSVWKWYLANNNWNGICNSGLIVAALAMYEENPDFLSQVIAAAMNCLPHYLVEFEPDGQSEEGLMYWSYGLMYTNLGLEAMTNTLGTTNGLADIAGLRKTGWFPFLMSGPVTSLNIGDDPLRYSRDTSFLWFARYYNDPALAKQHLELCMKNGRCQWQDIYFYDPELVTKAKTTTIPLDNAIRGIELYSIRENWDSSDAMYIAIHGGANNANHGHLDAGSFYIQALGEVFAYGNLGSDNYTYPGYFSQKTSPDYLDSINEQTEPGRWHFYRLRTEGKNCIVVNPTIRPEQKENGIAIMKSSENKKEKSCYTFDLTDCYERDLISYNRTIGMDRKRKYMVVKDLLECRDPNSSVWWFMHTKADIELQERGHIAILTMADKKMKVEIVSPLDASFQTLPATYLLKDSFPLTKNSENKGFGKLAIELEGKRSLAIEVMFTPLN